MVTGHEMGFTRSIARLAMLLFTALTLLSSGPHPFDRVSVSSHQHAVGTGVTLSQADASCPLCDWVAHSVAVIAAPPEAVLLGKVQALPHTMAASLEPSPSSRRPTGRAPPPCFT